MSLDDKRQRTTCSACKARCSASAVQILVQEWRAGNSAWLWQHRWLCPPCRVAHIDLVVHGPDHRQRRSAARRQPQVQRDAEVAEPTRHLPRVSARQLA